MAYSKKDKNGDPLAIAIKNTKYAIRLLKNNINNNNKKLQNAAEEDKRKLYALNVEKYEKELVNAEKDLEILVNEKKIEMELLSKNTPEAMAEFKYIIHKQMSKAMQKQI